MIKIIYNDNDNDSNKDYDNDNNDIDIDKYNDNDKEGNIKTNHGQTIIKIVVTATIAAIKHAENISRTNAPAEINQRAAYEQYFSKKQSRLRDKEVKPAHPPALASPSCAQDTTCAAGAK